MLRLHSILPLALAVLLLVTLYLMCAPLMAAHPINALTPIHSHRKVQIMSAPKQRKDESLASYESRKLAYRLRHAETMRNSRNAAESDLEDKAAQVLRILDVAVWAGLEATDPEYKTALAEKPIKVADRTIYPSYLQAMSRTDATLYIAAILANADKVPQTIVDSLSCRLLGDDSVRLPQGSSMPVPVDSAIRNLWRADLAHSAYSKLTHGNMSQSPLWWAPNCAGTVPIRTIRSYSGMAAQMCILSIAPIPALTLLPSNAAKTGRQTLLKERYQTTSEVVQMLASPHPYDVDSYRRHDGSADWMHNFTSEVYRPASDPALSDASIRRIRRMVERAQIEQFKRNAPHGVVCTLTASYLPKGYLQPKAMVAGR